MPPTGELVRAGEFSRRLWRHIQHIANEFWQTQRNEFLSVLQPCQKCNKEQREFFIGDIVLFKVDASHNQWQCRNTRIEKVPLKSGANKGIKFGQWQPTTVSAKHSEVDKIMQVGGLLAVSPPVEQGQTKPKIVYFTHTLVRNALHFNSWYVCCFQECLLVSSGIVIAIKFGIQFIDKNVYSCVHMMPDMTFFILVQIISILQNGILLHNCLNL